MKIVPKTFELSEDDIREAIEYWLNSEHNEDYDCNYIISFDVEERRSPPTSGLRGGMSDDIVTYVITATAEED